MRACSCRGARTRSLRPSSESPPGHEALASLGMQCWSGRKKVDPKQQACAVERESTRQAATDYKGAVKRIVERVDCSSRMARSSSGCRSSMPRSSSPVRITPPSRPVTHRSSGGSPEQVRLPTFCVLQHRTDPRDRIGPCLGPVRAGAYPKASWRSVGDSYTTCCIAAGSSTRLPPRYFRRFRAEAPRDMVHPLRVQGPPRH